MLPKKVLMVATFLAEFAMPAHAAVDGALLMKACKQEDAASGFCIGFIAGVLDTVDAQNPNCNSRRGEKLNADEFVRIILNRLDADPNSSDLLGTELIQTAFPCE
ncbi:MAG TPA: Rap1a/Tai family immunity protein [Alphaproteobacteria bacterium]|nr:Rap1a/Tai family immunity protein [Alphaproteobacteria bacterium]